MSHRDCTAAFAAAVTADYRYTTFYAVSNNADGRWDLEAGRASGFHPQDDESTFAPKVTGTPIEPQGGLFATPQVTLARQRHIGA